MSVFGPCFVCQEGFEFNADWVPSFTPSGSSQREPICEACMTVVNGRRAARGLEPHPVDPRAYEPQEVA